MSTASRPLVLAPPAVARPAHPGRAARVLRTLLGRRTAAFGLGLTGVLVVAAVLAPWIAPYRPDEIHPIDSLTPPSAR